MKIKIIPLGTCSANRSAIQKKTSFLINVYLERDLAKKAEGIQELKGKSQISDFQILLDAGSSRIKTTRAISLKKLKLIFISHSHGDHINYLGALIRRLSYYGRRIDNPLFIFSDPKAIPQLKFQILLHNHFHMPKFVMLVGLPITHEYDVKRIFKNSLIKKKELDYKTPPFVEIFKDINDADVKALQEISDLRIFRSKYKKQLDLREIINYIFENERVGPSILRGTQYLGVREYKDVVFKGAYNFLDYLDIKIMTARAIHTKDSLAYRIRFYARHIILGDDKGRHPKKEKALNEELDLSKKEKVLDIVYSPDTKFDSFHLADFAENTDYWLLDSTYNDGFIDSWRQYFNLGKTSDIMKHSSPKYSAWLCNLANSKSYVMIHYFWKRFRKEYGMEKENDEVGSFIKRAVEKYYNGRFIIFRDLKAFYLV
ncbi:MAG: MBL fold metallo-hydrolase [Promethearchaeota archaeon]